MLRIPDDLQNLYIIMQLWYRRKPFHNNQGFVQLVLLRGESRSGHWERGCTVGGTDWGRPDRGEEGRKVGNGEPRVSTPKEILDDKNNHGDLN